MRQISEVKFHLKSFKAISHAISTYEDMGLLLQHLVEGICRTFNIKASSILLYDETEKQLFRVRSHGLSEDYIGQGSVFVDKEFKEFLEGKTIIIDDLEKSSGREKYAEAAAKEGFVEIFSLPIRYKNFVIGLLKNYNSEHLIPHEEDLDSMRVLMQQLGIVIELNGMQNFVETIKAAMENFPAHHL